MASAAPPILPISSSHSTVPSAAPQSNASIATPAFRLFLNHITDTIRNDLSKSRPWVELTDRINYLTVIAAVIGISLITNPFLLLTLVGLLAAWVFLFHFRSSDPPL